MELNSDTHGLDGVPAQPTAAHWARVAFLEHLARVSPAGLSDLQRAWLNAMHVLSSMAIHTADYQAARASFERERLTAEIARVEGQIAALDPKAWGLSPAGLEAVAELVDGRWQPRDDRAADAPLRRWVFVEETHGRLAVQGARDDLTARKDLNHKLNELRRELDNLATDDERKTAERKARIAAAKAEGKSPRKPAEKPKAQSDADGLRKAHAAARKARRDLEGATVVM